jgi:biotin carboxyl carrier protein
MRYHIDVDGRKFTIERRSTTEGLTFRINEEPVTLGIHNAGEGHYLLQYQNRCLDVWIHEAAGQYLIDLNGQSHQARLLRGIAAAEPGLADEVTGRTEIIAPMPGKIVKILASPGTSVEAKQPVLIIEAMKMQNELRSPRKGTVVQLAVSEGQAVAAGTLLLAIE